MLFDVVSIAKFCADCYLPTELFYIYTSGCRISVEQDFVSLNNCKSEECIKDMVLLFSLAFSGYRLGVFQKIKQSNLAFK